MCCHGYVVTSIMICWIIQIGLFSLLSLRRLIYAWVPRGRLQLSFLCLNLRLPVLGNKPAMIINHRQELFFQPNLKSKSNQICHSSVVNSALRLFFFLRVCVLITSYLFALFHTLLCPAQQLCFAECLSQQLRAYSVAIFS